MLKYIRGELYRILCKKSLYILAGLLLVFYTLFMFIRSSSLDHNTMVWDANQLFMAIQVLVGGYFFATIYNDDIASRNLTTIIGYGFSKTKIAISKLLTMTIVCLIIFAIVPIIMTILFNVFGASPAAGSLPIVYSIATKTLLSVVGYAAISSILAFGLARPVMAMVCYVLFAISLLDNLLIMVFTNGAIEPITGRLADLMMNRITSNIAEGLISSKGLVLPIVEYIVYLGIVIVASVLVFNKKEMEF